MLTLETPMNVCFPSKHCCQFSYILKSPLFLPFRLIFCIQSSPWAVQTNIIWGIKNQLDATWYFIILLIGSTCFKHYYAHHQELATMLLFTTLTTPHLQHTANQERHDQCGKQHHSCELLMMDIVLLETCWAYKKYRLKHNRAVL